MPLNPLKIVKNWLKNTTTREENWDEIANKVGTWATQVNNNLKQIGIDLGGNSYDFNNNGVGTHSPDLFSRMSTLEAAQFDTVGVRNLGLDLSTVGHVKLVGSNGNVLSASNAGYATFNSTVNTGQVVTRSITAGFDLPLVGAHWGNDTFGDLSAFPLYVYLFDTGSAVIMGVGAQSELSYALSTDCFTGAGSVVSNEDILVSSAPGANLNAIVMAKITAAFDDTGNAGGENYWTMSTGVGTTEIIAHPATLDAVVYF